MMERLIGEVVNIFEIKPGEPMRIFSGRKVVGVYKDWMSIFLKENPAIGMSISFLGNGSGGTEPNFFPAKVRVLKRSLNPDVQHSLLEEYEAFCYEYEDVILLIKP